MLTAMSDRIDFVALMPAVAKRLLGEPNPQLSNPPKELRFGTHGSVKVNCVTGQFFDHEANVGGGVTGLIEHKQGCDHNGAVTWLRREGFLSAGNGRTSSQVVARYNYADETGATLFQVIRFEPKDFRQRRPDGNGGWISNLKDTRRVLYKLPELIEAVASDRTVFIVEGEKDVRALWAIAVPATCNAGGAGKWRDEYSEFLRGADVVIVPDNDPAGRDHSNQVAKSLAGIAKRIRILKLAAHWPECPKGGDLSDWLKAGHSREELDALIEAATEVEKASEPVTRRTSRLVTVRASDVKTKRIDALWKSERGAVRLARGEHTLIAGEPGLGKTQLALKAAATITRGDPWPCGEGRARKGHVIILSAEDDDETTLKPRLIAAGADCDRVTIIKATYTEDGKGQRAFDLQTDIAELERLIEEIKEGTGEDVLLIIIDPITAYMGGGIDGRKNVQVRATLRPVGEMARRTKVAILSITHFNKGTAGASTKALYRVIDSVAFTAAPRAAFTVMEDPDDENIRLVLHLKNNLGPKPDGLAFRIFSDCIVGSDDEGDFVASYVSWESKSVKTTADEALNAGSSGEPTAKGDAVEFLRTVLADGPVAVPDLEAEAKSAGYLKPDQSISQSKPFRSAREDLGIKPAKAGMAGGWVWALPKMPSEAEDALQNNRAPSGSEGIFGGDDLDPGWPR
jgi:putative DNA primase/helicase